MIIFTFIQKYYMDVNKFTRKFFVKVKSEAGRPDKCKMLFFTFPPNCMQQYLKAQEDFGFQWRPSPVLKTLKFNMTNFVQFLQFFWPKINILQDVIILNYKLDQTCISGLIFIKVGFILKYWILIFSIIMGQEFQICGHANFFVSWFEPFLS